MQGDPDIIYRPVEVGEGVVYPSADTVETLWPLLGYSAAALLLVDSGVPEIHRLVPRKVIYERQILSSRRARE